MKQHCRIMETIARMSSVTCQVALPFDIFVIGLWCSLIRLKAAKFSKVSFRKSVREQEIYEEDDLSEDHSL